MTIVRPVCARLAPPQKPVFHGSCANRSAAQSDHSMASRQQRLGAHSILVLHNAAYRPNPNPRTGGPSHSHLRGTALAQHNIYYRTFPHSVVQAGFQAVFAGGTQRPRLCLMNRAVAFLGHRAWHGRRWRPRKFTRRGRGRHPRTFQRCEITEAAGCCAASEGVAAFYDKGSSLPSKPRCGTAGLARPCLGARRDKARRATHRFASGLDEVPHKAATPPAGLGRKGSCQRRALWVLCPRQS